MIKPMIYGQNGTPRIPAAYIKTLSGSGVKEATSIAKNICAPSRLCAVAYTSVKPHDAKKGSPNVLNA